MKEQGEISQEPPNRLPVGLVNRNYKREGIEVQQIALCFSDKTRKRFDIAVGTCIGALKK